MLQAQRLWGGEKSQARALRPALPLPPTPSRPARYHRHVPLPRARRGGALPWRALCQAVALPVRARGAARGRGGGRQARRRRCCAGEHMAWGCRERGESGSVLRRARCAAAAAPRVCSAHPSRFAPPAVPCLPLPLPPSPFTTTAPLSTLWPTPTPACWARCWSATPQRSTPATWRRARSATSSPFCRWACPACQHECAAAHWAAVRLGGHGCGALLRPCGRGAICITISPVGSWHHLLSCVPARKGSWACRTRSIFR